MTAHLISVRFSNNGPDICEWLDKNKIEHTWHTTFMTADGRTINRPYGYRSCAPKIQYSDHIQLYSDEDAIAFKLKFKLNETTSY